MGPFYSKANKEKFVMLKPTTGKVNVTCCLPVKLLLSLQKQAYLQKYDLHKLVDHIVLSFRADYNDINFFYKGEEVKTVAQKAAAFFKTGEEREFCTFQIEGESFKKIMGYKNTYTLSKSIILKRLINKYVRIKEDESF